MDMRNSLLRKYFGHVMVWVVGICLLGVGGGGGGGGVARGAGGVPVRDFGLAPVAGMGVMVGEVTSDSAFVQVRLTQSVGLIDGDVHGAKGVVEFRLEPGRRGAQVVKAEAGGDFIARVKFEGLVAGRRYKCYTRFGVDAEHLEDGPVAQFRTLPGAGSDAGVKMVVVTGMNYAKFHGDHRIDREQHLLENNTELAPPYMGDDKQLGYPALEAILKKAPDYFVGTGDNVYYDTPDDPRAETVAELRQKWHEQFVQPRYVDLFAKVGTYWEIDDHDYRIDDGDNSGDHDPSPAVARAMILEQLPVADVDEADYKMYRTHRLNRDLQIWFVEGRVYRSDNLSEDGPGKSIWGAKQKAWLKRTLLASDAKFKVMISPTPMIGPDDLRKTDNHTNAGGFQYERDAFFGWLKETGLAENHFYLVCGDRHWQYRSVHPLGIEEFSTGALIDTNARPGRMPGDALGTDPEGLIKQPYSQQEKSGGFLMLEVGGGKLSFKFHDEHGVVLYEDVKE